MLAPSPPTLQQKLSTKLTIKRLVHLPVVCISRPVVATALLDESLENTDSAAVEAAAAAAADSVDDNKEDQRQVAEGKPERKQRHGNTRV